MNTLNELIEIVRSKCPNHEITEDTELKSLGMDSLDFAEIIMDAEDKYGIFFEENDIKSFVTIKDVVKAIESKK